MVFHGSRLAFHGSWSVFMVFIVPGWFFMVPGRFIVFHCSKSVFMVFHGFWLVSIVLLVQNTTNCILARRSSLGLAGRRPALA